MSLFFTKKQETYKRYKLHKILREHGVEFHPQRRIIKIPESSPLRKMDAVIELIAIFNYHLEP